LPIFGGRGWDSSVRVCSGLLGAYVEHLMRFLEFPCSGALALLPLSPSLRADTQDRGDSTDNICYRDSENNPATPVPKPG